MENNEITLEKIELVKDRTGVSYKEAKEALELTNGSVVDAIISIEDSIDSVGSVQGDSKLQATINIIKDAVKKGNVTKLNIKKNGEVVTNIPLNVGIIGTVLFPWAMVAGVIAAFGTGCTIELIGDNGSVINVSEKANDAIEIAKSKGGVIYDEAKDKGKEVLAYAKDKGGDLYEIAKDKGGDLYEYAKDKGEDLYEMAKDKGGDLYEAAKDKTMELVGKLGKEIDLGEDIDISDIDLENIEEEEK